VATGAIALVRVVESSQTPLLSRIESSSTVRHFVELAVEQQIVGVQLLVTRVRQFKPLLEGRLQLNQ
jgi:hypothetical protein